MKKIGIFGGTFDPPHIGHLIIADEVKFKAKLDEIWFIPTYEPPHKQDALTTGEERFRMVQLATQDKAYFYVHDIELKRTGKSYTIDTVKALRKAYKDVHFSFIIGGDMVEYLEHWYKIDELVKLIEFIGVNRPGYTLQSEFPVTQIEAPYIECSSSEIRKRIQQGEPFQYMLPQQVYAFIKEHKLYGFK